MDKYEKALVDSASKLDAITSACGEITKCTMLITKESSNESTICLLKKISDIIEKDYDSEIKRVARVVHTNLIEYYGYNALHRICTQKSEKDKDIEEKSLDVLLSELNSLIGLEVVKNKINDLIAFQRIQMMRAEIGMRVTKGTMHLAFTGNPGTGKTTVARIIGHVYKQIGLLSKGHFTEVSRTDLIAGYQGQTALKVKGVIEKAKGGVLFIDEAYSITENEHSDSYGRECLTELTKALEDYRDDLVVIVAGYTKPMEVFFESNPGLRSRFNHFIEFPDYSAEELMLMLENLCKENDYVLNEKTALRIEKYLNDCIYEKDDSFANGRLIRNIYDEMVMNHARRVVKINAPTTEELSILLEMDFSR